MTGFRTHKSTAFTLELIMGQQVLRKATSFPTYSSVQYQSIVGPSDQLCRGREQWPAATMWIKTDRRDRMV